MQLRSSFRQLYQRLDLYRALQRLQDGSTVLDQPVARYLARYQRGHGSALV
jgi:hypothetical protein